MSFLSTAGRKIRTASAMPALDLSLVVPVIILLGIARLAILLCPFRWYAKRLGQQVGLKPQTLQITPKQAYRARRTGRIVRLCARITPWQSLCLAQAMVATALLRLTKTPYHVYFGLSPKNGQNTPDPLAAHAWVRLDEYNITGGQNVGMYTVVNVFEYVAKDAR
mgnify:CR=1 FL=1